MQPTSTCPSCEPAAGGFFANLFSTDFVPRAACVGDRAEIIWLHVISDAAIALAYYSIPLALAYFVWRRRDVAFPVIFWLFAAFILACGTTHVFSIIAFWYPLYRLDGVVKAGTGGISILTAAVLWPLVPKALALPSPARLERLNADLAAARDELEERVKERTAELGEANRSLLASKDDLQRKLAEIESLYRTSGVGVCLVDRDLTLVRMNHTLAEMVGGLATNGIGEPVGRAFPVNGPLIEEECRQVIRTGAAAPERTLHVETKPVGRSRYWLLKVSPVKAADESVLAVNLLLQDITERQLIEERLRQSQKIEAVGQLAAGIAHEINNSLTAIFGYLSAARAQVDDPRIATEHMDHVLTAAEQAGQITKALLTFSRKDASVHAPVEIRAVVDKAMSLFAGLIPANIRIETDCADAAGLMVLGDTTQLQQIVLNLAINARDAMPRGGTLRLELKPIASVDTLQTESVRLLISDTGIGMTREVMDRLFEPFFTTKPRGHGTGLGTSVVHGIVKAHGGEITVESSPGRGTTFLIDLPICQAAQITAGGPALTASPADVSGAIVFAEDSVTIRSLLASGLRAAGFHVVETRDGGHLLERTAALRAAGTPIAAFVLDVDMPVRSGLDCLRQIRAAGDATPVVLITGGPIADTVRRDNTHLLPKPFHVRDLIAALLQAVCEGRTTDAATDTADTST